MEELIQQLKVAQATAFSLYLKAHNFHWNVTGPDFAQYHTFLDTLYNQVFESIDEYAEKIRTLDSFAPGSLSRFLELTRIEDEMNIPTGTVMMYRLAMDNSILIDQLYVVSDLCDQTGQQGIQNFIQGKIEEQIASGSL